ncbi:response regulator transcription factor [Mucilaginibacter antarcticus]|uniref:Response regulator transcription factor n=1 Tax=Mucilaginibacter antarcticus TaxID=1855725 RepID=A0ABW5XSD1_9SPHI
MQKKILVIDNDIDILDVMYEVLKYEGFDVKAVLHTTDIVQLVDDYQPDLLLIDYILDGVNGGEICSQIKAQHNTTSLPVILISAYPKADDASKQYCCNAFISKPFDLDHLTGQINRLLTPSAQYVN